MFRETIKREAERQQLSGYALAKLSGVAARSVQLYLAGQHDLKGERAAMLAQALGLELRSVRRTKPRKAGK